MTKTHMRILIGGIMQESNTFSPATSTMKYFKDLVYLEGEDVRQLIGAKREIGGFFHAAQETGAALVPTLFTQAVSAGRLEAASFHQLKANLIAQIRAVGEGMDGMLLVLHGAMTAEDADDAEGEILTAVREVVGPAIPIVITLDSHANVTRKMVSQINGLIGYRTYPHVDYFETGYKAARLLFTLIRERKRMTVALAKVPMIVPAENMQTDSGPMHRLFAEADNGERAGNSIVTSLFPVQPWLDIEELGFAAVVVHEDAAKAQQEADRLARLAWEWRSAFEVKRYTVQEVVSKALEAQSSNKPHEPLIISDSADATGAGSPGDSNAVLKALLELGAQARLNCLLCMVDPGAVAAGIAAGIGSKVTLQVGYYLEKRYGQPIAVEGIVSRIGTGRFTFGTGFQADLQGNMGKCLVLEIGKISLLLMENPTYTVDPAMYRSMGLEPKAADLVLVKSALQFKSCYASVSNRMFILDTPGSSTANLRELTYRNIRRPFYPFDDHFL